MADDINSSVFAGLGTYTYITPTTGPYVIEGHVSRPTMSQGATATSQVVTTINVNASPKYTGTAGAEGFRAVLPCTAGDTITIVFTSAAAVDAPLNVIKSMINISHGV